MLNFRSVSSRRRPELNFHTYINTPPGHLPTTPTIPFQSPLLHYHCTNPCQTRSLLHYTGVIGILRTRAVFVLFCRLGCHIKPVLLYFSFSSDSAIAPPPLQNELAPKLLRRKWPRSAWCGWGGREGRYRVIASSSLTTARKWPRPLRAEALLPSLLYSGQKQFVMKIRIVLP